MVIRNNSDSILWFLTFFIVLGFHISYKLFFILSILVFLFFIKAKLVIPKLKGFRFYVGITIITTIVGCFFNEFSSVIKDLFYILPTIMWIVFGFALSRKYGPRKVLNSLYLVCFFASLFCFFELLHSSDFSFANFRVVFANGVYDVGFVIPLMAYEVFVENRIIFNKKFDRIIIFLSLITILLSFARIAILEVIIEWSIFCFLGIVLKKNSKLLRNTFYSSFVVIVLMIMFFLFIPTTFKNEFVNKLSKTFLEIDTKNVINSEFDAMNNWRASEMQDATKLWQSGSLFQKFFGFGMGKKVVLKFVPINWIKYNLTDNGAINLLHNGFYTLLIKGGILYCFALLNLFISNILFALNSIKKYPRSSMFMIGVCVSGIANTYVWRGPVAQFPLVAWALLVSALFFDIRSNNSILE